MTIIRLYEFFTPEIFPLMSHVYLMNIQCTDTPVGTRYFRV